MNTLTANDAKRNFAERLLNAQREPIKISKNNEDAVEVMSIKDYEELKIRKSTILSIALKTQQET